MKKNILFLCFYILVFCNSVEANANFINLDTLSKKSQTHNKIPFLFFHISHCPYCEKMESQTLQYEPIQNSIKNNFTFIDINTNKKGTILFKNKTYTNKEFANLYDVHFFPTVLFLDDENEVIYKARGYRDQKTFQNILQFITRKMYEEMSFFEYQEQIKGR